jgi:hypothetical protein
LLTLNGKKQKRAKGLHDKRKERINRQKSFFSKGKLTELPQITCASQIKSKQIQKNEYKKQIPVPEETRMN